MRMNNQYLTENLNCLSFGNMQKDIKITFPKEKKTLKAKVNRVFSDGKLAGRFKTAEIP